MNTRNYTISRDLSSYLDRDLSYDQYPDNTAPLHSNLSITPPYKPEEQTVASNMNRPASIIVIIIGVVLVYFFILITF